MSIDRHAAPPGVRPDVVDAAEVTAAGRMRTLWFTVLSNLMIVLLTPPLSLGAMIASLVPPRGDWSMPWARWWSRLYLRASGVRVEVVREHELPPGQGVVYLANHQSMVDIAVLLVTVPGQVRFVAKQSLFRIPFFGWSLKAAGFVAVDRSNVRSARDTFKTATDMVRSGRSMVIFPEETRSLDGRLLPFKRGGVLLALKTGFPIVPVGIRGTRHVRPKGSWLTTPHPVRVRYGRPIVPAGGLAGRPELEAQVRAEIERLAFGD